MGIDLENTGLRSEGKVALIIDTDEVLKVVKFYKRSRLRYVKLIDDGSNSGSFLPVETTKTTYLLSNGKEYKRHDIIIGSENIRNYRIGKIISEK